MNIQTFNRQAKGLVFGLFLGLTFIVSSCGQNTGTDPKNVEIPGVQGPNVTIMEENIVISMVFENVSIDLGARVKIPEFNNSFVELSPHLQSGGTLLSAIVAIEDILDEELRKLDPLTLPGGRPLPGVMEGKLPAVAFTVEKFENMSFYLGPQVFGSFYPVDLGYKDVIATHRFYVDGKRVGNLSLVGNDQDNENGGILLMLDLDAATKKQLKSYLDSRRR